MMQGLANCKPAFFRWLCRWQARYSFPHRCKSMLRVDDCRENRFHAEITRLPARPADRLGKDASVPGEQGLSARWQNWAPYRNQCAKVESANRGTLMPELN